MEIGITVIESIEDVIILYQLWSVFPDGKKIFIIYVCDAGVHDDGHAGNDAPDGGTRSAAVVATLLFSKVFLTSGLTKAWPAPWTHMQIVLFLVEK